MMDSEPKSEDAKISVELHNAGSSISVELLIANGSELHGAVDFVLDEMKEFLHESIWKGEWR